MTRVNFYILPHSDALQRKIFACRLVEKAYHLGHNIYLHTDSTDEADHLDQLLWTFSGESFLPHSVETSNQIQIGHAGDPGDHHDVLINLSLDVPEFFSRFNKVSEIVCQQDVFLTASRNNWKFYQDRGYPLQSHKIQA